MKKNILLIDDEEEIKNYIYESIDVDFNLLTAFTSAQGLDLLSTYKIDLILLDLILPDIDGLNLCKLLKNMHNTSDIPIIILTAKNSSRDLVEGLEMGADDYVTKPFDIEVLLARIKAVLRRQISLQKTENEVISVHNIKIYPDSFQVFIDSKSVDLTKLEFRTLYLLANNPGIVFTRSQISDTIKSNDYDTLDRSVDSIIVRLRKKLDCKNELIETVWGVGYRLKGIK